MNDIGEWFAAQPLYLQASAAVVAWEIGWACMLTWAWRLGAPGRAVSELFIRAPVLDLVVACLTWVPWAGAIAYAGWPGFGAAIVGQIASLYVWTFLHELANREAARGPRIVRVINQIVGPLRNHLALWVSLVALPVFWGIRVLELFCYAPLVWMVGFPRYRQGEWVNVSRQKFEGLVGHDLIWCLYCDWMTGVYSLGAEMLRNVESFWCPIRFYDGKKCENCKADFPDIDGGWVKANGTMKDVETVLLKMYPHDRNSWFGHPDRKTPPAAPTGAKMPV